MMSGARNYGDTNLSEKLFARMKMLFPDWKDDFASASILLANTYSSTDEQNRSWDLRKQIRESGIKVQVGLSWTYVDGQLFVSSKFVLIISRTRENDFCIEISSSRSISSSIRGNLCGNRSSSEGTRRTWPQIRFEMDYPTAGQRWNNRVSSFHTQWKTGDCFQFDPRVHSVAYPNHQKSSNLRRLSWVSSSLEIHTIWCSSLQMGRSNW